MASVYQMA